MSVLDGHPTLDFTAPSAAEVLAENGGRVRRDDPSTSKHAALLVRAGNQRGRILAALAECDGLTGHEAAARCGVSYPHVATTRLEELEHLGFAVRTSATRSTPAGGSALVWVITEPGRAVAEQIKQVAA